MRSLNSSMPWTGLPLRERRNPCSQSKIEREVLAWLVMVKIEDNRLGSWSRMLVHHLSRRARGDYFQVPESLRVLLTEIIDYAGLFPPAKLDMRQTVCNWSDYFQSEQSWMLARLIVPASRLDEFEQVVNDEGLAPVEGDEAWRLSVLVNLDELDGQIDRIFEFNQTNAAEGDPDALESATVESVAGGELALPGDRGGIVADAIELRVASPRDIDRAMRTIPEQLEPYFELSVSEDLRGMLTAMAGTGARAKIRTGSVIADEIPTPEQVATFIKTCAAADVAFKATAGLHHPLRAEYALTYADDSPRGVLFGFLNMFFASALAKARRVEHDELVALLDERDAGAFTFDDTGAGWREHRLDLAQLARARESFAASFGSCSFTEPVEELAKMNLIA